MGIYICMFIFNTQILWAAHCDDDDSRTLKHMYEYIRLEDKNDGRTAILHT